MRTETVQTNYCHNKGLEEMKSYLSSDPNNLVPKPGKHILYLTALHSTWFADVELHEDNTVTIIRYDRDNMPVSAALREGYVIEYAGRVIKEVAFRCFLPVSVQKHLYYATDYIYPVRNQKFIFDYK